MAALVQARISRANAAQRAGRAGNPLSLSRALSVSLCLSVPLSFSERFRVLLPGRVRAGVCYHLFLKWEDQNVMLPQQLPEVCSYLILLVRSCIDDLTNNAIIYICTDPTVSVRDDLPPHQDSRAGFDC